MVRVLEYQMSGTSVVLYLSGCAFVALAVALYGLVVAHRSRGLRARIGAYTGRR